MTRVAWMATMVRECRYALMAIQYFTRLPTPSWVGHSDVWLSGALRYITLVGGLVGGMAALAFTIAQHIWTTPIAVALALLTVTLTTGAIHEDGLADAIDGLGGSWDRARALEIMKDSRVGSFGVLALVLTVLLKWTVLSSMTAEQVVVNLITAHVLSRASLLILMWKRPYVGSTDASKAKPLTGLISPTALVPTFSSLLIVGVWIGPSIGRGLIAIFIVTLWWRRVLDRALGGYTGDCLGAAQQLTETAYYLASGASLASLRGFQDML